MTKRLVTYEIEHCNSMCPHFFHNYKDGDNIWCELLKRRIFENFDGLIWDDMQQREIPQECKLPVAQNNGSTTKEE